MTDHFQKTIFPGAGNRNHCIIGHHYMSSFTTDILFHLVKVDDVRFMDTKEGVFYKLLENRKIENSTSWAKLNAATYSDGIYVVQVVSGERLVTSTKWVVQH